MHSGDDENGNTITVIEKVIYFIFWDLLIKIKKYLLISTNVKRIKDRIRIGAILIFVV